jgi:hypothetical protein
MTKYIVSKKQYDNLIKAAELARGPGHCEYTNLDSTPKCVIGQLAFLEGVPIDTLLSWDNIRHNQIASVLKRAEYAELLQNYPRKLLGELQRIWDNRTTNTYMVIYIKRNVEVKS